MDPICRLCKISITPLFSINTKLVIDEEEKEFANIYESVTKEKVQ